MGVGGTVSGFVIIVDSLCVLEILSSRLSNSESILKYERGKRSMARKFKSAEVSSVLSHV